MLPEHIRRYSNAAVAPQHTSTSIHQWGDTMQSENRKRNRARSTQAFAAVCAAVMITGFSNSAAKAAFAYVSDGANDVLVVDTLTNAVVARVTIAGGAQGVAVTPDGKQVYVTNLTADSVSVINTAINSASGNIQVDRAPGAVAISPDGKRAYVSNFNSNTVSVIDTREQKVITPISLGTNPTGAAGLAVSPDGKSVYVANAKAASVIIE